VTRPAEVFDAWSPGQRLAGRHARAPLPSIARLRSGCFLPEARAERITQWYAGPPVADARDVALAYGALTNEVAALARAVTGPQVDGGLGIRVALVQRPGEPYAGAAELCRDVRDRRTLRLRAASVDPPHPLLCNATVDQLHTVHDVLGHAALGLGFDLQSEYAAWLYCRPLFSAAARAAAFCELAGAVTSYVLTGRKPVLRADLPPSELLTVSDRRSIACESFARGSYAD
jgi:hypothetical protein